jgi:zinc transport system substrate-binding protein
VARLTEAQIFFTVGVPAENHLLPRLVGGRSDLVVVDTAADITRLPESAGHGDHDHGDGHALDPHVWLAPRLVMIQARHVAEALCEHDPAGAAEYRAACATVLADLAVLDTELAGILAPVQGRTFFVLHPAFGYFAAAYGLHQSSLAANAGDASPRQLAAALDRVRIAGARAVFTQPQVSLATSRAMAREAGVELVVLDPLAADWDANLRHMAQTFREALDDH